MKGEKNLAGFTACKKKNRKRERRISSRELRIGQQQSDYKDKAS